MTRKCLCFSCGHTWTADCGCAPYEHRPGCEAPPRCPSCGKTDIVARTQAT